MTKRIFVFFLFLIILISFIQLASAESKYTREKSEELFHLIDWHEYNPETFKLALKEQKPIYLVISAPSWCYWCHVYESEDYLYHPNLYPYINENFISIFVDSDKRPDLTRKYLEGGWPSTTIFTPNMMRIQGFSGPRDPIGLRDYLKQLIVYLKDKSFTEISIQLNYQEITPKIPVQNKLIQVENNFLNYVTNIYDTKFGGFGLGNAPEWREGQKFPRALTLKFLLEKYEETKNDKYLDMVKNTFKNQYTDISELKTRYHLYDPVEGGFHRYSTKRNWSIPHYEKLLSDQAKLIRAYAHLSTISDDINVKTAVYGSISFVINKFYDNFGFYSSQDAYLEENYYELTKEERAKIPDPYIDKTKKIDSNSMMISTFLYLYDIYDNQEYKEIAQNSLDFLKDNMIDEGAYYYFDQEKKKSFLTGQSLANSYTLLAFINGFETINDESYLETAKILADYSLNNLYDWSSGGFFERNSKDIEFYAPNERIDLSRPYEQNAVFSYAMLRLYLITENLEYLEAGLKTLGYLLDRTGGLDQTYYIIKSSQLTKNNNLIEVYNKNLDKIDVLVKEKQEKFFLDELLAQQTNQISLDDAPKLKNEFTNIGFIILAILAFAAGILSFLSPCTLPVLSAYFANNFRAHKGEMLKNTLLFFLGLAVVFSLFGMGATFLGNLLRDHRIIFTQIAGSIIIIFGILEIFGKGFSGFKIRLKNRKTPIGSFLFGTVFAIGWSACISPILASLLLLSSTTGTIFKGSGLLFIYALGLGIPLIIISLYFDRIKNQRFWSILQGKAISFSFFKKKVHTHSTSIIVGIILIILGILIFNDYLFKLNQLALQTDYVQNLIIKGEIFLKNSLLR